jgi:hypothetical protein
MGGERDRVIGAALRESLSSFDDASLATLANAGLVRRARKDVEEGKVSLVSAQGDGAQVEVDGQQVTMDLRGLRLASCSCKSVAVCRHKLAAVLFLQGLDDAGPPDEGDPAEIIAALDLAGLRRWAGKAAWRAALDMIAVEAQITCSAHAVSVQLSADEEPVRILRGQGFEGIVSKVAKARMKAVHAAAVLAARRHFVMDLPVAEQEAVEDIAFAIEPAFLALVAEALKEVTASGFNLAPLPLEETLFELSVSSRADNLPRLSAMLRALAAQMRMRRQRHLGFDPERMMELAATAFALCRALGQGEEARRLQLAGKVRRDFAPAAPFRLVGCGGEQWRSESGARGVTAWFMEPETGRWLSTTLARGRVRIPLSRPAGHGANTPLAGRSAGRSGPCADRSERGTPVWRWAPVCSGRGAGGDRGARGPARSGWAGVVHHWDDLRAAWLAQTGLGLGDGGRARRA